MKHVLLLGLLLLWRFASVRSDRRAQLPAPETGELLFLHWPGTTQAIRNVTASRRS
jgi:hypothetical protein